LIAKRKDSVARDLATPALAIDLDIFESNLRIMADRVHAAGRRLRPHAKAHKSPLIGRKQLDIGAVGLCCATVLKAETMVDAGLQGILVTTPVVASAAIARLVNLGQKVADLMQAANADIARDEGRLGKTLFTRKDAGERVEIVRFHNAEAEAHGIVQELLRRAGEGAAREDMAILYGSSFRSRGFEEALIRARIPHVLVGDVGFHHRAEIKDALAFLRIALAPDHCRCDEVVRRVINVPTRGFGAKAMETLEAEGAWRKVSLLVALETAQLPARSRSVGLKFADAIRNVGREQHLTLADPISPF
jgi:hypothetical protein